MKSRSLFMNTPPQNATDQQREGNDKHTRFLRWALNNPTEEFSLVPFSPEAMEENQRSPWGHGTRRSAAVLMKAPPPLDKIEGRYVTRELMEPDFKGIESLKEEALINRRSAMDPEFTTSHKALNQFRRKRSDFKAISGLNDDVRLVKRLDKIDRGEWPLSGRRGRIEKSGFDIRKRIPGSGYDSWEKKNFDDSDRYGYSDMRKRNFDEIDRAGFHSLSRRNFDEIDRAGFHSLGRRNFDEIDRAGLHSLGRRNFDEIDRAGFRSLGKRNFDEIDRAGFHSLGRRNFDEIDKSAFRGFGKRDFDEIDRSGFRSFGKRNFDEIDRSGFRQLGKRSTGHSTLFDDNSKDSGEAYKVEDYESRKRNSDDADKVVLRNFSKRSTDGERSKISN